MKSLSTYQDLFDPLPEDGVDLSTIGRAGFKALMQVVKGDLVKQADKVAAPAAPD